MFTIKGEIKVIGAITQITDKFKKRDFMIVGNSFQYPQFIKFQLTQDRCSLIDSFNIGKEVSVSFNIRGREWTDKEGNIKYFNALDVWRLEGDQKSNEIIPEASNFLDYDEEDVVPF
jgi:hypothetical protein